MIKSIKTFRICDFHSTRVIIFCSKALSLGHIFIKALNRQLNRDFQTLPAVKIVQFGGGNFLRAFVDWMVEEMNHCCAYEGGVAIVKPTPGEYDDLIAQGGLYHVITRGIEQGQVLDARQRINCIVDVVSPYRDFDQFVQLATLDTLELVVSNTTESGIVLDPSDSVDDKPPSSFPAKLCLFLKARYDHFAGDPEAGLVILPCELVENNAMILRDLVVEIAKKWRLAGEFIEWLKVRCIWCNTLVDRIVPGRPEEHIQKAIEIELEQEDNLMVVAEPYHLWAIEGPTGIASLLPFDRAGINIALTDDLSQFRTQKVRLLNGGHTAMVPIGMLMGIEEVRQFVEDPVCSKYLDHILYKEIIPSIEGIDPYQLRQYAGSVLDRFRNPFVKHRLSSIALNSISKFMVRIFPSMTQYFERHGVVPPGLTLALAALIRFYRGTWQNSTLPIQDSDSVVRTFRNHWQKCGDDFEHVCQKILSDVGLWGQSLDQIDGLKHMVAYYLQKIEDGNLSQELKNIASIS